MAMLQFLFYKLNLEKDDFKINSLQDIKSIEFFDNFDIISFDHDVADFVVKWLEEKTIHDCIFQGKKKNTTYYLEKTAFVRVFWKEQFMITSGLGKRYSRFIQGLLNNNGVKTNVSKIKFELLKLFDKYKSINYVQPELSNIIVEDLPVDLIANASVHIKECQWLELEHLVKNTNAYIDKITLNFINTDFSYATLYRSGKICLSCLQDFDYQYCSNFIEDFINVINFKEYF